MDKRSKVTIDLDFPVEFDGRTVTSITMRRPKGRDILKADRAHGSDTEKGFSMMVDLTEEPLELLMELDEADIDKLGEQLTLFKKRQDPAQAI